MAIEPEFVRLMKRWILPVIDKKDGQQNSMNSTSSSTSGIKPIQLDDDEIDLR